MNFGKLVLVLGDIHVPYRAADIPAQFKELLVPNKMDSILCTGNLCSPQMLEHLRTLAPNVHVALGEYDTDEDFPQETVVQIEGFSIGIIHGHQVIPWGDAESLADVTRRLGVDILVTGHTHQHAIYEYEGKFVVNPGTITGAYTATNQSPNPSFVLMSVNGDSLVTYLYELKDDQVFVVKSEYTKPAAK